MNAERRADLLAQANRILPDLLQVREQLEYEPATIRQAFSMDAGLAPVATSEGLEAGGDLVETAVAIRRDRIVKAGQRAVDRLAAEGPNAALPPDEEQGLEAIVLLTGRPAILFHDGRFDTPLAPWQALEQVRAAIERVALSVGRINLIGNPAYPYGGTGFMVAEDVIMTNRHVAKLFSKPSSRGKWVFESGMGAGINYTEYPDTTPAPQFDVEDIVVVHPKYDLALLRLAAPPAGQTLPQPLTLSSRAPSTLTAHQVYVLGYPAYDPRNGADIMRAIFADVYNVKRLQPGTIIESLQAEKKVRHDCSTLGGNSGSCLLDMETHQVIGLHFSGLYLRYNEAFALWQLKNDPVIKKAGLNYSS